ncbi:MAG: aminotransferase class I/II-fold pyridoxal phosphate-dependent enzyme [Myxococcota bacterium]|jgi:cystathionine gamma-synthase|nr:cystathionine gamma-synthase [Deltaproteobacteria bacterium]MCP4243883.1 cystathionine gamma-synthase [bacterium]MDP6073518.1 aminotransferase class I/II-fold pyridoxal phosphate-dependent enzyme [Myxococcota bacterium]MDP6243383.1 aminotransferase class I/II-fold pyridoxal phosphate-dependent enzyme [Myxococcota bacterium]MDP7076151.1 aminotransferase class I/II-fold pyridoxal phosphate-dependent enzyme [Myxococcota bacterium]
MAEKPRTPRGSSTSAVHGGEREHQQSEAITTPIYQTSTFWFRNSDELIAYQEGRLHREEYGRYGNPTWKAVERKLCELDGAEAAALFASGMCAATTLFFALLPAGSHLVVTSDCYRRTRQFIRDYLMRMGVETTVIDPADTKQLENALRDETALFFTESPTNPYLRVIDVAETARICHARGAKVVIDATFATPVNHRPLDEGADLVIHSATKYLGGHNDLLAGTLAGSAETVGRVRDAVGVLGGVIDAHSAWLLLRGLKTLALRVEHHNRSGLRIAEWLEKHPRVRSVWYPMLASHPDHETAARSMRGGGGVVTFELDTDLDGAIRFTDACRIPYIAPSFGGVESLIEMPVTTSFWDLDREERLAIGITDSLIRYSCGVEDADDLIADLDQALSAI